MSKFTVTKLKLEKQNFETKAEAEKYLKSIGMRFVRCYEKNVATWVDVEGNVAHLIDNKPIHF